MAKPEEKLTSKDIEIGGIVTEPGSARQYRTGDWKSKRPIVDFDKCTKCGLCAIYCPEGCFKKTAEGYYEPDMYYCKGCGICAAECPKKAVTMIEEKE
ncbi:MAG: 4Fe-4S binding protein [Dehalococcoidia bacterium]|nr:4Fe-4S binding protein [Dehalococcoidia bacterium]